MCERWIQVFRWKQFLWRWVVRARKGSHEVVGTLTNWCVRNNHWRYVGSCMIAWSQVVMWMMLCGRMMNVLRGMDGMWVNRHRVNLLLHQVRNLYLNRNLVGLGNLHFLFNGNFDVFDLGHSFDMMLVVNVIRCVDFEELAGEWKVSWWAIFGWESRLTYRSCPPPPPHLTGDIIRIVETEAINKALGREEEELHP